MAIPESSLSRTRWLLIPFDGFNLLKKETEEGELSDLGSSRDR
jgi:hypothetical protein